MPVDSLITAAEPVPKSICWIVTNEIRSGVHARNKAVRIIQKHMQRADTMAFWHRRIAASMRAGTGTADSLVGIRPGGARYTVTFVRSITMGWFGRVFGANFIRYADKECDEPKCSNSSKLVGKTKRSPWCAEHGCQQDMCKAAKYFKNFNLNSKYCTGHTCIEADCLELAGDTNHRCGRHTCAHATCYEPIVPKSEAEKGDTYCSKHKRCNVGTCNQEVKVTDNYRALKHCKDHYCTFEHECDDQRKDTSSACERHTCRVDSCNRKISGIQGAVYCSEGDDSNPPHECRNAQCTREAFAAVDSRFCVYHICRDYMRPTNCKNGGNPQKDGYCETHERCVLDGCVKLRFVNGRGERQDLCVDHARPCDTPGCGNPRAENGRRCNNHVCLASNDCQGIRVPLSTFCSGHKCAVPECPSQRRLVDGGLSISTLMALDPTGNNLHLALGCGAFCAKHTCAHDGCRERNFQEGKFCATHTCRSKACLAEAQYKADYCPWHTCQSRNCTSEITEDGQHCVVHTCITRMTVTRNMTAVRASGAHVRDGASEAGVGIAEIVTGAGAGEKVGSLGLAVGILRPLMAFLGRGMEILPLDEGERAGQLIVSDARF
ncbi:NFX1-type zinc finger-containing protein [Seiridium cupressi]